MLAVGTGKFVALIATGTGGQDAHAITEALLHTATNGGGGSGVSKPDEGGGEEAGESSADDDDSEVDEKEAAAGGGGAGKKASPVKWQTVSAGKGKGKKGGAGEAGVRVVMR